MPSDAPSILRVAVANALAKAHIIGVECCHEEGIPLTQNQQIEMLRNSIMAYDEALTSVNLLAPIEQYMGSVRVGPPIQATVGEARPAGSPPSPPSPPAPVRPAKEERGI